MNRKVFGLFCATILIPSFASSQSSPRDTVYVVAIPGETTPKPPAIDSVFLVVPQPGDGAWFSSQYAAYARVVALAGVKNAGQCESREVEFTYLSNAGVNAAPPSVKMRGEWVERDSTNAEKFNILLDDDRLDSLFLGVRDVSDGNCVAVAHWRLGDNPGRHYLRARLVRKEGVVVPSDVAGGTTQLFTAIAHAPPAIVAGMVYLFDKEDGQDDDAGEGEGEEDEESERTLGTIVGFDFPIVSGWFNSDTQEKLQHFRPMIATDFSDPGEDVYVGLEILPLAGGARSAANPLQLTIGWKFDNQDDDTLFLGLHYSTTGLLSDFLKAVGL